MTRLRAIPPRLACAPGRLAPAATSGTGFARTDGLTPAQRGYDADWRRVRAEVLREQPWCPCGKRATDVDHIQSFRGIADPLRLARSNLRALCHPCHMARTARQSHGQG